MPEAFNIWRYKEFLGLGNASISYPFDVGGTPLIAPKPLLQAIGLPNLMLKDETKGPTASNKDRATALVIELAVRSAKTVATTASTGNAAISLAFGAAAAGLNTVIFVGPSARDDKLRLMQLAGATVFIVRSGYQDAVTISRQAAAEFGWADRNTGYNPLTIDAKKTVVFEIWEQLEHALPDVLVAPVGDGVTAGSLLTALQQIRGLGLNVRFPRIIGVQSAACDPLVRRWCGIPERINPDRLPTIADGIAVTHPASGDLAIQAVRDTSGAFVAVSDEEIQESMRTLARYAGLITEPSGAVALAGISKAVASGLIHRDETIVALITGARIGTEVLSEVSTQPFYPIDASLLQVSQILRRIRRIST